MRLQADYRIPDEIYEMKDRGFIEHAEEVSEHDLAKRLLKLLRSGKPHTVQMWKECRSNYQQIRKEWEHRIVLEIDEDVEREVYVPKYIKEPMPVCENVKARAHLWLTQHPKCSRAYSFVDQWLHYYRVRERVREWIENERHEYHRVKELHNNS